MSSLTDFLYRSACLYPDKPAVICGDNRLSYQELENAVSCIAGHLAKMGLGPGQNVALSCPNIPQFLMVYYGIIRAGATVVPLNILLQASEITYHLQDSQAAAYFCFEGSTELPIGTWGLAGFEAAPDCRSFIAITADPNALHWQEQTTLTQLLTHCAPPPTIPGSPLDTAAILYTSGTTGKPKGAELSHYNLTMNTLSTMALTKTDARDVHLAALPLFHSFAQTVQMHHALAAGSTLILVPRFDASQVLTLLAQEKVTVFAGVPTLFIGLYAAADTVCAELKHQITEHLRICISGGGPMPTNSLHQFEQGFQVTILEGYGLSETSPVACFNGLDHKRIVGSVGRPIPGVAVDIVDPQGQSLPAGEAGELLIKGHNVMKGYFNQPEQTAQSIKNQWFYTGDIARCDESGNIYIIDRIKDLIIRGGFNVYPREVEEVLMTHPDIQLAAVIGVPDSRYVEEIMACIVLKPGADISAEAIGKWAMNSLGRHKYPRHIRLLEQLPMTITGKVLKRELKAQIMAQSENTPQ